MKKFVLTFMAMVVISTAVSAQRDNMVVRNDSDPNYGCPYTVTPIVVCALGKTFYVPSLTMELDPEEEYTYSQLDLRSIVGSGHQYVGVKVTTYGSVPLEVGDYLGMFPLEEFDPSGDCGGGQVDAIFDPDHIYGVTSEMYITDEQ